MTKAGQSEELARRKRGEYFGEAALLESKPTIAAVSAASPTTLLRLEGEACQRLMGNLKQQLALRKQIKEGKEGREGSRATVEEEEEDEFPEDQAHATERLHNLSLDEVLASCPPPHFSASAYSPNHLSSLPLPPSLL